jgi:hypothetical protein
MFEGVRSPLDLYWQKANDEWRPRISNRQLYLANSDDLDSELLSQLPFDRLKIAFVFFDFAARKFPETPMPLLDWTLANQESAVSFNYRGNYSYLHGFRAPEQCQFRGRLALGTGADQGRWRGGEGRSVCEVQEPGKENPGFSARV